VDSREDVMEQADVDDLFVRSEGARGFIPKIPCKAAEDRGTEDLERLALGFKGAGGLLPCSTRLDFDGSVIPIALCSVMEEGGAGPPSLVGRLGAPGGLVILYPLMICSVGVRGCSSSILNGGNGNPNPV
jgi:hypothetical protein